MKKSVKEKSLVSKALASKFLVRKPLKIAQFFSVFAITLILLGGSISSLNAEEASDSSVAAVNINTATSEELAEALNGIGAKKAQAIVQYRNQNGPFTDANQLLDVKGIGEATLSKNSGIIVLK